MADKTRCFNEWYVRHPKHTNLYYMYYYTNDSALPEEGRYRLQLNNGMNDISIRRDNDGQIFEWFPPLSPGTKDNTETMVNNKAKNTVVSSDFPEKPHKKFVLQILAQHFSAQKYFLQ